MKHANEYFEIKADEYYRLKRVYKEVMWRLIETEKINEERALEQDELINKIMINVDDIKSWIQINGE